MDMALNKTRQINFNNVTGIFNLSSFTAFEYYRFFGGSLK